MSIKARVEEEQNSVPLNGTWLTGRYREATAELHTWDWMAEQEHMELYLLHNLQSSSQ